jgi:predicted O-methyltransferase YrrM
MRKIEELWELLKDVELIQVRPSEMEAIYKHIFEFRNPTIVEIGSAHGASSIILGEASNELDGHLVCIDSYPENYYDQEKFGEYAYKAFKKNMVAHLGTRNFSFIPAPSDEAVKIVQQLSGVDNQYIRIDILFIDGDHSYDGVIQDCQNYLPLLKSGGYVAFHDYNNVAFGVKQAADRFCSDWGKESIWDLAIFKKP